MGKKKLDDNDYKRVLQLNKNGYTNLEIANIFRVTSSRIGQILRENGIHSMNNRYLNFSEDDCQKIITLYNQGLSTTKIGKMFDCSRNPITKILRDNDVKIENTLIKIPKNEYQNVANLYYSGKTQKEIADIYGCTPNAIHEIMKKLGINARPNGFTENDAQDMYIMYQDGKRLQEIADVFHTGRHTVGRTLKRNGFKIDKKTYHCDEHYFDNIDDQNKAYIAGLLWADGCNQLDKGKITIQLQERDQEILQQIKEISNNERPLLKINLNDKNPNWQNSILLTWQSKNISQILNDYGMVPRKSLVLEFPFWLDKSLYPHFLRGYIDGDGSVYFSKSKNYIRVSMVGTKMFLNVVKNICYEIEVKTYMSHKNAQNEMTCSLSTTSNKGTLKLLYWIYADSNLKLQRKYNKYQQALEYYNINNTLTS